MLSNCATGLHDKDCHQVCTGLAVTYLYMGVNQLKSLPGHWLT